jgi:hypothetical protein
MVEVIPKNILDECGTTKSASTALTNILGFEGFDYPKPVELIKHILSFIEKKNLIVLDFFAGSGTTGQAVMELNKDEVILDMLGRKSYNDALDIEDDDIGDIFGKDLQLVRGPDPVHGGTSRI